MPTIIEAALADYGEAEIPGAESNAKIAIWIHQAGIDPAKDETSWCGAAMRHWCAAAGYTPPPSPALARSWMKFGYGVEAPEAGDIVVFWREAKDSWKGHVALFVNKSQGGKIRVLGGNQGDMVHIAEYDADHVLGYRRPA